MKTIFDQSRPGQDMRRSPLSVNLIPFLVLLWWLLGQFCLRDAPDTSIGSQ